MPTIAHTSADLPTEEFIWTDISDGPSREEMFDCLRLYEEGRMVTFKIRRQFSDRPNVGTQQSVLTKIYKIKALNGPDRWMVEIEICGQRVDVYYTTAPRREGHVMNGKSVR